MALPLLPIGIGLALWYFGRQKGDTLTIPENDAGNGDSSSGGVTNDNPYHIGWTQPPHSAPQQNDGSENLGGANSGGYKRPAPPAVPSNLADWTQKNYDDMNAYYAKVGSAIRVYPPAGGDDVDGPPDETLADIAARTAKELADSASTLVKNTFFGRR